MSVRVPAPLRYAAIRIRGNPTTEELAGLLIALAALTAAGAGETRPCHERWSARRALMTSAPAGHADGAWRASALDWAAT